MENRIVSEFLVGNKLDVAITRIPPGKVSCPFHFHHAMEELFYVMSGTGKVRYGDQTHPVKAGMLVSCPPGPASAHQFINDSDEPLVYMAIRRWTTSRANPWRSPR